MTTLILLLQLFSDIGMENISWKQSGYSSYFATKGDKFAGGPPACLGGRSFPKKNRFCAHRTYRCGTVLLVYLPRNGKKSTCIVVDRGPYGAIHKGKWVLKTSYKQPGRWRGIIDLGPIVAKDLGHTGIERTKIFPLFVDKKSLWLR